MRIAIPVVAAALVTACSIDEPRGGPPMALVNGAGQTIGTVRAWQTAGGVTFRLDATGLPHGVHGTHVHSVGRCEGPDFTSAGPHWNPTGRQHGINNPNGQHAGDLAHVDVAHQPAARGPLDQQLLHHPRAGDRYACLLGRDINKDFFGHAVSRAAGWSRTAAAP